MIILTNHGFQRLYERVQTKAQVKTLPKAKEFLMKVLGKGIATVNDTEQMLIAYANNLYIFKKNYGQLVFVTVKTSEQHKLDYYSSGKRHSFSYKKNFALSA